MERVLSGTAHWPAIEEHIQRAAWTAAAIAYVTRDIGLKSGLLLKLTERGVEIFSHGRLQAKCLVFDRTVAIVTSGNASDNSCQRHFEVGLITDDPVAVARVQAVIEEKRDGESQRLERNQLLELVQIEVTRSSFQMGSPPAENDPVAPPNYWTFYHYEVCDTTAEQQANEELGEREIRKELSTSDVRNLGNARWPRMWKQFERVQKDDIVIWASKESGGDVPAFALPATIVDPNRLGFCWFVEHRHLQKLPWEQFMQMCADRGVKLGSKGSERSLAPELAKAVLAEWPHV